jgi:HEAT repeat protein
MKPIGKLELLIAVLLVSGCFQEEAPRHEATAAVAATAAVSRAGMRPAIEIAEDDTASVPELVAMLEDSVDPEVRREAIYAIADEADTVDAAIIGNALYDPDAIVRLSAVEALTGVRSETSADWLSIALGDPDPLIRQTAVEALGEIGGDTARFLLQQALADVDPGVREAAQQMLEEPARADIGLR